MVQRTQQEIIELYEQHCDMVYRNCYLYLKHAQDAYDATQETFLRLIQYRKKFKSSEHAKAWLLVTSSNYCKDVLKSSWRKKQSDCESIVMEQYMQAGQPSNQEQLDEVLFVLMELPERYRTIVYLHYYEGYSLKEIAKLLHKNASTIRSRLSKAKQLLRERLKEDEI